jgi:class 3 adenylate cyclase
MSNGSTENPAWLEGENGTNIPLPQSCTIGRSSSSNIVITNHKVSRRHALIHKQSGDEYWVADLGSGNGTYLNGRRLTMASRLSDRDALTIGDSQLVFRQPKVAAPVQGHTSAHTIIEIKTVKCWLLVADVVGSTQLAKSMPAANLAMLMGGWLANCKQVIEDRRGVLNKFLGDGLLAFWVDRDNTVQDVAEAIKALQAMQATGQPRFRLILHLGDVSVGGGGSLGEDSLTGLELGFAFRMEKLASGLGHELLVSEKANSTISTLLPLKDIGRHALPGFASQHPPRFFAAA